MTISTVNLFKVLVAPKGELNLSNVQDGFITDFKPSSQQLALLKSIFKPLPIVTLFSVEERKTASIEELLLKQVVHYFEVYGLNAPGLFDLEVRNGKIVTLALIRGVTVEELTEKVNALIYANRPIADVKPVIDVINTYDIKYDINKIANNELRVALYRPAHDTFVSGDDAVRYICYHATDNPMLIKSKQVIAAVRAKQVDERFLLKHVLPLAQVFNRHKKIILACKNKANAAAINKISHLSKSQHVPIHESVSKHFISGAVKKEIKLNVLDKISLRDKLKYLNLIEYKLLGLNHDTFVIRNGKIWCETNRTILDSRSLEKIRDAVVKSVSKDLVYLQDKNILLDPSVKYGLPISRKQTLGNLPFGTTVVADGKHEEFSAGIYWHNDWSLKNDSDGYSDYRSNVDLDLSAITDKGERTGWGGYNAYSRNNPIVYSGDMVDASRGATEFMVVNPSASNRYGLMVNIFNGGNTVDAEIVVGYPNKKDWQDKTIIRERITLQSKQSVIGFLKDNKFVVYSGRLNESRVSQGKHPVIDKGLGNLWTVNDLFDDCGIKYDTTPQKDVVYDFDLSYNGFSLNKLEELFKI